jgi:hypothetical protein
LALGDNELEIFWGKFNDSKLDSFNAIEEIFTVTKLSSINRIKLTLIFSNGLALGDRQLDIFGGKFNDSLSFSIMKKISVGKLSSLESD